MNFKEGSRIAFELLFGFGYSWDLDPFRKIVESNLSEVGDVTVRWPDYMEENGIVSGTAYDIPVGLNVYDDFDEDSIRYLLKNIKKQAEGTGMSLAFLKIQQGNDTVAI